LAKLVKAVERNIGVNINQRLSQADTLDNRQLKVGVGPFILLNMYILMEFLRPQYFVPVLEFVRPGLILGIAMAFYWVIVWGAKSALNDLLLRLNAFILVVAVAWVPFATNNNWAFQYAKGLFVFFAAVTVPLGIILQDAERRHKFVKMWILVHVYLAIFAITHAGHGPGSFLLDENDLALALCMCLPYPFFYSQLSDINGWQRTYYIAATLVMILGIIWSNSRGGFVGLMGVSSYMLWISKHRFRNLLVLVILGHRRVLRGPR